jgi:hypothetical protein
LPATDATYLAIASICWALRMLLNAGMPPPPFRSWRLTVASFGFRSSRFGPTVPLVPASASVWQLPQFVLNSPRAAALD